MPVKFKEELEMPLTVAKAVAQEAPKAATFVQSEEFTASVDSYIQKKIELDKKLAKLTPLVKEVEKLEAAILAEVDKVVPANQAQELSAPSGKVEVATKGPKRFIVSMEKVAKALEAAQKGLFLKVADVTMKNLEQYLSGEEVAKLTEVDYVNKRKVKVVPK